MGIQIELEGGKKFSEFETLTAAGGSDTILVLSGGVVKQVKLSDLQKFVAPELLRPGASRANSLITEYSLGSSFTAAQSKDIRDGKFDLVRTGGYWTINGRKYWAAHADYSYRVGDTQLTTHHMLVIPDGTMGTSPWNATNTTEGGYANSKVKTEGLDAALETIKSDFGTDHILTRRVILANAVSNGASSGWAWFDSQIDLMSERMVYGSPAWGSGSQNGYDTGCDKTQLALFQARPDLITNRSWYWLRDVRSAAYAAGVNHHGHANSSSASNAGVLRPAFLVY